MKSVLKFVLVGIGSSLACLGCGSGYSVIAMSSPSISQISPQVVAAGTPGVTLLVKGSNFDGKSAIVLNGAAVPTSVVSSDTLSTQVAASVLAQPAVQQLQVQNSYGVTSNAVKLTVEANQKSANTQLAISTTSLQAATVASPYTATLAVTGGGSPYTWSVKTGSLPAGLNLSAAGVLSGTPTTPGNSTFTVQVKDSSTPGQTQTASLTLVVAAPVTTASPLATGSVVFGAGQVGVGYTGTLTASGGTSPYTWWISAGSLPAGLTLSSEGVISGTPTASGTSNFTISVHDSSSPQQTLSKNASITVTPANLAIVTSSLPSGTNGAPYSASLAATGGTPAYKWSVSSGKLPTGLSLSSNGVISGDPAQNGNVKFTVSVQDSGSPAQSQSASFSIHVSGSTFSVSSTTLASGRVATAYTASLGATGGTPGYTWSIASGSLPPGLSLSSTGLISGTPTAAGTSSFSVAAQDSSSPALTATASESITIQSAQLLVLSTTLPAAKPNNVYTAALGASGGTPGYTWAIASGSLPAGLSLSSSGVISGSPTTSGSANFTVSVKDSSSPQQTATATEAITVAASNTTAPLTITSASLGSAQVGTAYAATLQATGGTGSYTWSLTSGTLPAGLALSTTTGTISGTPTTSGTSNLTVQVADASSPVQTQSVSVSIPVSAAAEVNNGPGTTWYVRPDGGTRYSSAVQTGQCDGKSDSAYPGSGTNQHCAFKDVRYMWMDGTYGNSQWVMAGGDTLVIRGCAAMPSQQNPDAPHCRIGWDKGTGNDAENFWCAGVSSQYGCSMPPPPSGTATQHTRILGACAYGVYSCNPVSGYPYTNNNLTQLFGGFGVGTVMYLNGSSYVDVEGIELTEHNGTCTRLGAPAYPAACRTFPGIADDFANTGISSNNTTSNITLQDIYVHGFTGPGVYGAIGGPFTLTRVSIDFNAFAGWNFDDGTKDGATASLTQSYVSFVGNGCLEEYPIQHSQFPAKACWDSSSGGFGDAWSGQDTNLTSFTCDHCYVGYNTKDGAIGPHTIMHNLVVTNSYWVGNMGQGPKFGVDAGSTTLFQNNLLVGNCLRMSQPLPGAAQNFNQSTGLPGSYLSNYCRAGGAFFAYSADKGSTINIINNTIVTYEPTIFQLACITVGQCGSTPFNITNNIILGYTSTYNISPFNPGQRPGLYWWDSGDPIDVVGSHNVEYGVKNGDNCGTNGIICSDPLLQNEPSQAAGIPPESVLDVFNTDLANSSFRLTSASPAFGEGVSNAYAPAIDYAGHAQTSPTTIGAFVP